MQSSKNMEKSLLTLYLVMFRIGCVTFGGGYSIIAQMDVEFAENRGWIKKEDLLDFLSLSRSFPGIMVVNFTVLFGYRVMGVPGALAAALGLTSPAILVLTLVTYCYNYLIGNMWVERAMVGVRCAVIPIIAQAAVKLWKNAFSGPKTWVLAALSFGLCVFTGLNKLILAISGAILGLLLLRKEARNDIS